MGLFRFWTIGRATGIGVVAGLFAFVLWPFHLAYEAIALPFQLALLVTAFCGTSILGLLALDVVSHRRGKSIRPLRVFDLALGLLLSVPALFALQDIG